MEPAFVTNGFFAIVMGALFVPALIGLIILNLKS